MSDKILKLDQAQTLYQDLRGRIDALPTSEDIPDVPVQDVQVAGSSVVGNDGVANIPVATKYNNGGRLGVVSIGQGLTIQSSGMLFTDYATLTGIKAGATYYMPITPVNQHATVFYGLSKVAGVDLANETVTLGTYPETSKTAIKEMLGVQDGLKVVRLI